MSFPWEKLERGQFNEPRKRKKADTEALLSPFMKIPSLNPKVARAFLDLGLRDIYDLRGRCPEALYTDWQSAHPDSPDELRPYFRLAVYFADEPDPDPDLLQPWKWE